MPRVAGLDQYTLLLHPIRGFDDPCGSTGVSRTTTRLIEDLQDPANADAWAGFDARYRPVLVGFVRALGFGFDDAAEIAQQAMAEFSLAYRAGRYERGRGRLSSWLIGIARNLASDQRRRCGARRAGGDSALMELPACSSDEAHLTRVWAKEREAAILAEAVTMLRNSPRLEEHTMRAFELFVVRGMPAAAVAAECGIDIDSVYVIKNRLLKRLREIVGELTAAYDDGE